jgi:hypothetical protein
MNVPEFERGSTRIAWECLSTRERELFERLEELRREYGYGFERIPKDVLADNCETLNKAVEILLRRVFDLFFTAMTPFLGEDELYEWIFMARFHAFLVTTLNIVEMRRREDAFYDQVQEKYGDDWPDDLGEPDYTGIGERDFDKALETMTDSSFVSSTKEEQPKDGSR